MPISKRKLTKCLEKKFHFAEEAGSKHEKYVLRVGNRKAAMTFFSRSHTDISDGLLSKIARQLGVDSKTLLEMVDCTVSNEDYLRLLDQ
jgi:thiamine monophosphate kinase